MILKRRLTAEWLGTFSLLATVIGSGIMAERLADGNVAIALLGNTIPTGAILVVLITIFRSSIQNRDFSIRFYRGVLAHPSWVVCTGAGTKDCFGSIASG